jgi:SAM-dependent methyltransferase
MSGEHEPLAATLLRLKEERDAADTRYNDALTALDRAPIRPAERPPLPPAYDEQQITPLNQSCDVLVTPPSAGGLKGRLAAFVWRLVAPTLQKQATFNSILVDHVNRNVVAHREVRNAVEGVAAAARGQIEDLLAFRGLLLLYLQQITGYVDTKDRDTGGRVLIVNAAVNGVADDMAKRWESMVAREQRFEGRVAALTAAHDELRALTGISQQASLTMKRELERLLSARAAGGGSADPAAGAPAAPPSRAAFTPALDAYKYVGFEDQFRGSREVIGQRLESYLPYFEGASDVLDVGCGRGEFLEVLATRGVTARGLDLNHEMAEACRAHGLNVAEADVVSYLEGLPDGSLGGLFAAQVVEHLEPAYLLRFLELAHHKLRPGSPMVLETLNPACWVAFFESFIRDITHVWPLHPETLRYLVLASGFTTARIEYRSPVPPQDRLQPVAPAAEASSPSADFVEAFNANVEKLNDRMFTFMDYAIVAEKVS